MTEQPQSLNYEFTVATVVKNNAEGIRSTIESVVNQSFKSFQYVVVDGGSNDGTLEIIKDYSDEISILISSRDNGVYDAMNKCIRRAEGKWIIFMNSGDNFASSDTLKNIHNIAKTKSGSVIYGDCLVRQRNSNQRPPKLIRAKSLRDLAKGSCFSHQSAFIPVDYHKLNPYDTSLKISADFKFFYNAYLKDNVNFFYTRRPISVLQPGGLSDKNQFQSILEWSQSVDKSIRLQIFYALKLLTASVKYQIKKLINYY